MTQPTPVPAVLCSACSLPWPAHLNSAATPRLRELGRELLMTQLNGAVVIELDARKGQPATWACPTDDVLIDWGRTLVQMVAASAASAVDAQARKAAL